MITDIRRIPIQYIRTGIVNSTTSAEIHGIKTDQHLIVGSKFKVPEKMEKILVTDRIADVMLERTFVWLPEYGDRALFPICVKIYEDEESNVLIFLRGVEEFLHACGVQHDISFLNVAVWNSIVNDLRLIYGNEVDYFIRDMYDVPRLGDLINNDALPTGYGCESYPWGNCRYRSELLSARLQREMPPTTINIGTAAPAKNIFTTAIYQSALETADMWNGEVLYRAIEEITEPYFGDQYRELAYDTLTETCIFGETVDLRQILLHHSYVNRESRCLPRFDVAGICGNIKNLDIDLGLGVPLTLETEELEFCTWLHNLNAVEVSFKYILPKGDTPDQLIVSHYITHSRVVKDDRRSWKYALAKIFRHFYSGASEVEVHKNSYDECVVVFHLAPGDIGLAKYYDLTMATILSQNLAQVANRTVIKGD